jgi:hypothetical protein
MLAAIGALLAFSLCCYGWGRTAHAVFYPGLAPRHAFCVGLGLVALSFIGGVLNAAALAVTSALAICAYVGIGLGIIFLARTGRTLAWRSLLSRAVIPSWLSAAAIAGLGIFLIHELMPSHVFDYVDDFFSYMVRTVRMLATGTVGGNPFDLLPQSDFGVQEFLQGILLVWLPLDDSYAFDTIFCFLLGIGLLLEAGRAKAAPALFVVLSLIVYLAINPQIVNISSVYSTAVLVVLLMTASTILVEAWDQQAAPSQLILRSVPVGAIAATLIAVKLTGVFFVLPFCAVIIGVLLAKRPRDAALVALAGAASGTICVLGWLIAHLDKFNFWAWTSSSRFFLDSAPIATAGILEAFRDRPTLYGGTRYTYLIGVVAVVVCLATALYRLAKRPQELAHLVTVAAMAGGVAAYVGIPAIVNNEAALRYSIPFLIALVPVALFAVLPPAHERQSAALMRSGPALWIAAIQIIFMITLIRPDAVRLARIVNEHSVISIPVSEQNRAAQAQVLSNAGRARIRAAQSAAPAGATIWAWVDAPFNFDLARNRVWTYNMDWAVAPWRLDARTADELRDELRGRGVQYIVWQYDSTFIPSVASLKDTLASVQAPEYRIINQAALELSLALKALAAQSDVVWNDGSIMVLALRGVTSPEAK